MLLLQGSWVQSLVRELRSPNPRWHGQKAKKYIRDEDDDDVVVIYVFLHDRDPHFFFNYFLPSKNTFPITGKT